MAMPASSCISLRACITGVACSSIACAVDGNATGNKCLSLLSTTAAKTAPHSMSEFYGYYHKCVSFSTISQTSNAFCCCKYGCLAYDCARETNDCYYPCYCWWITKSTTYGAEPICVQILCNGVSIYCCGCVYAPNLSANGTFAIRCVDYNDCINVITQAEVSLGGAEYSQAYVCIISITKCVGDYRNGSLPYLSATVGIVP